VQGSGDFRAELKDECLKQEIVSSLKEAQTVIGMGQNTSNRVRLHLSLGSRPPAPVTVPDLAFKRPMAPAMQSPLTCQNTGQVNALNRLGLILAGEPSPSSSL
jgi:hypothetical protein